MLDKVQPLPGFTWRRSLLLRGLRPRCCMLGWLLLLSLVVVQLDGQRHRPPLQTQQENLNLTAGFDLVLPSHGVVGKDGPARARRQRLSPQNGHGHMHVEQKGPQQNKA